MISNAALPVCEDKGREKLLAVSFCRLVEDIDTHWILLNIWGFAREYIRNNKIIK